MCCYRYYTIGTAQKDWYLPALGEIIYLLPRNKEIIDGLVLCGVPEIGTENYSVLPVTLSCGLNGRVSVQSSTEYGPSNAFTLTQRVYIQLNGGCSGFCDNNTSLTCVAFIKI